MAELLAADGWVKADSAGSYLREALPDDYLVVADARPCGQHVPAAVVGRTALFIIDDASVERATGTEPPSSALRPKETQPARRSTSF